MSFVPCIWDDDTCNGRMILAKTLEFYSFDLQHQSCSVHTGWKWELKPFLCEWCTTEIDEILIFLKQISGGPSVLFVGVTDILFWTSDDVCCSFQSQGGSPRLACYIACMNGILRFTSGVTPTAASMAAELFSSTYLQTRNLWGSRLRFLIY